MTFGSNYGESDKIFCQENTFRNNVWKVAVIFFRLQCVIRDYFVHAASQWETTLQCNVVSHWLAAYTKWSLCCMYLAPMESESCHLLSVLHWSINSLWPETCFNIYIYMFIFLYKDSVSRYGDSHYKDKTVTRPSYLYNGNPYTGNTTSLYIESDPGDVIVVRYRGQHCLK